MRISGGCPLKSSCSWTCRFCSQLVLFAAALVHVSARDDGPPVGGRISEEDFSDEPRQTAPLPTEEQFLRPPVVSPPPEDSFFGAAARRELTQHQPPSTTPSPTTNATELAEFYLNYNNSGLGSIEANRPLEESPFPTGIFFIFTSAFLLIWFAFNVQDAIFDYQRRKAEEKRLANIHLRKGQEREERRGAISVERMQSMTENLRKALSKDLAELKVTPRNIIDVAKRARERATMDKDELKKKRKQAHKLHVEQKRQEALKKEEQDRERGREVRAKELGVSVDQIRLEETGRAELVESDEEWEDESEKEAEEISKNVMRDLRKETLRSKRAANRRMVPPVQRDDGSSEEDEGGLGDIAPTRTGVHGAPGPGSGGEGGASSSGQEIIVSSGSRAPNGEVPVGSSTPGMSSGVVIVVAPDHDQGPGASTPPLLQGEDDDPEDESIVPSRKESCEFSTPTALTFSKR